MKHLIYALLDKNSVPFYVGKTCNLPQRKRQHLSRMRAGSKVYLYNKLRKMDKEGFPINASVIEDNIELELVDEKEKQHIARLRSLGHKLCNLTEGGEGNSNPSKELRALWSKQRKGKKRSAKTREKISNARKGIKFSDEHKAKLRNARRKRKISKETRERQSTGSLGKINTKTFRCISPDGKEYITTNGLTAFCREHNLPTASMHRVADSCKDYCGWKVEHYGKPNSINDLG